MGLGDWLKVQCNIGTIHVTVIREGAGPWPDNFSSDVTATRTDGANKPETWPTECDQQLSFTFKPAGKYKITVKPPRGCRYRFVGNPPEVDLPRGGTCSVTVTLRRLEIVSVDIAPGTVAAQKFKDALTQDKVALWKQYINVGLTEEATNANANITKVKLDAVANSVDPVDKQKVLDATLEGTPGRKRAEAVVGATIPKADAEKMVADGAIRLRTHKMHEERAKAAKKLAEDAKTAAENAETAAKTAYDTANADLMATAEVKAQRKDLWEQAKAKTQRAKDRLTQAGVEETAAPAKEMDPRTFGRNLEFEATLNHKIEGIEVYFDLIPEPAGPAGNYPWQAKANDGRGAALKEKVTPFDALTGNLDNTTSVTTDKEGIAKANFKLSRIGGDKFVVVAGLKSEPSKFQDADFNDGLGKKSRPVQVWRRIWYQLTHAQNACLPPRGLAQDDFKNIYVVADEECETVYHPIDIPGLKTASKWQFDTSAPKGTLYPGKSAVVMVELLIDKAELLAVAATREFVKFKDASNNVTVQRRAEVVGEGTLTVTAGEWTPEMNRGDAAAVAKKEYTLKNTGGRAIEYTVSASKDWLTPDTLAGTLSPGSETILCLRINRRADALRAGSPSDTCIVTVKNITANKEERREVKLKVVGESDAGKLRISPSSGILAAGAVGSAFTPNQQAYTITNISAKTLRYRVVTDRAWLKLGGAAWDQMKTKVEERKRKTVARKQSLERDRQAAVDRKNRAEQQLQTASAISQLLLQAEKSIAETKIRQIDAKLEQLNKYIQESDARLSGAVCTGLLAPNASAALTVSIESGKVAALESGTIRFGSPMENAEYVRTAALATPVLKVEAGNWTPAGFKPGDMDAPLKKDYEIENTGDAPLNFSLSKSKNWLLLDVTSGILPPKSKRKVRVETTEAANELAVGNQTDTIRFANDTNTQGTDSRTATIQIQASGTKMEVTSGAFSSLGKYDAAHTKMTAPFDPKTMPYEIKNTGAAEIEYTVSTAAAWLRITGDTPQICVGEQNVDVLKSLLLQPPNERPKTAHLILCDRQWDAAESKTPPAYVDHTSREFTHVPLNDDDEPMGAFIPPLQGGPFLVAGARNKWRWDGHSGAITNDMISINRGRRNATEFVITLPATCPGCTKVGCGHAAILPTGVKKARVKFRINGANGPFLGEGGNEASPHTLIVLEDTGDSKRDKKSVNDTISHEVGHMHHQTQGLRANVVNERADLKKGWKKRSADEKENYENLGKDLDYYYEDGTPVHPNYYTERGGEGPHCSKDASHTDALGNTEQDDNGDDYWYDGKCIIFAAGSDDKLNWCEDCQKMWKYINMSRFSLS